MPQTNPQLRGFSKSNVLFFLLAFRICNALLLRTFFQPDEYFQSLEPAWDIAFGPFSGAWITWEWRERLRSSLHPLLFAGIYRSTAFVADVVNVDPNTRAELLLAGPKVLQACFAALTDYFIWRLAIKSYGKQSQASTAALSLTVLSPWQWFCSTRTLSNCLETTLTTLALLLWPSDVGPGRAKRLRAALALAALATVLRPTNAMIWIVMALTTAFSGAGVNFSNVCWTLLAECREAVISGTSIVGISLVSDRLYYGQWTFPPLRFIHFNVVQSLAVFYGKNRPDYYFTEGLPLLLTTALPFTLIGIWQALISKRGDTGSRKALQPLAISAIVFIVVMSQISHKEVRFIFPLLPALLVTAAGPFSQFFSPLPTPGTAFKKILLLLTVAVNVTLALYISQVHQRGVIDVLHYLRHEYEQKHMAAGSNMTVMFLMPCHSTPWRSHLVHTGLDARALTCEPPLDVPIEARDSYLDEADQFYEDPIAWMQTHMEATKNVGSSGSREHFEIHKDKADWPEYLVFFEHLEPVMIEHLSETRYERCWRGFNTHWHDDSRRHGDVVVWCLNDTADA